MLLTSQGECVCAHCLFRFCSLHSLLLWGMRAPQGWVLEVLEDLKNKNSLRLLQYWWSCIGTRGCQTQPQSWASWKWMWLATGMVFLRPVNLVGPSVHWSLTFPVICNFLLRPLLPHGLYHWSSLFEFFSFFSQYHWLSLQMSRQKSLIENKFDEDMDFYLSCLLMYL